jgi:hypothetical protein
MFLEELANIIQDEGVATIGTDLFYYSASPDRDTYALLMFGGDGIPVDNELPGYYNTKYQVIVRSSSYDDGFQLANDVRQALTFYGRQSGTITFNQSLPRDEPRPFRRNEAGIIEFSNNFIVSFVKE